MLSKRELQTAEQLQDLMDQAHTSSAHLTGYLSASMEYTGRMAVTEGHELRAIFALAAEAHERLLRVHRRVKASKELFPTVKVVTKATRLNGTKPKKRNAESHPWKRQADREVKQRAASDT